MWSQDNDSDLAPCPWCPSTRASSSSLAACRHANSAARSQRHVVEVEP